MRDVLILELRNAVADKEWNTAAANGDIAEFGKWAWDWEEGMRRADTEIQRLLAEIKALDKTS